MNTSISITINMDGNTEKHGFHYRGKSERDSLQERLNVKSMHHFYRHFELIYNDDFANGKFKDIIHKTPGLSDEFMNEQIPSDLSNSVTWKDVLLFGMIPELRDILNENLRDDIQFLNQSVEVPSPAPAPAPEPTTPPTPQPRSEIVIEAKAVKNNVISCKKIDEKIVIIYEDNEKDEKYVYEIIKDSEFWNQNNMYFQGNFDKCYNVLNMTFTERNFYVKWKIKDKDEHKMTINISFEDALFGFSIDMILDAEEKHIEKLEKKVQELEKKLEKYDELEDKVRSLCEYITYKETIDDGDERTHGRRWRDQMGHDNSRDWDVPMEEPGSPKYNELSQTKSGYRKEIWKKVMEEKGWTI